MSKWRRFTADFKARVAVEALLGDETAQEIAARHKLHQNQESTWKKQALEGPGSIFENGAGRSDDREGKVRDLHAKIGELAVQNDFLARALKL